MKGDNLRKNASGYSDPTAYQAIMNADAWFCWSATPCKRNKFDKEEQ